MDARLRRLASDYEQIKKDFAGHKNIVVTPISGDPPEKYHVTYYVNGIYLQPDGRIETLGRHEVEITLHAEYPRYKPICKILTPIWHPNFRDGQICIGDIWGAGESLTDIIINIGDMIQYKSWNSYSPLSADAAAWAMENKHLFPVGNVDLNIADYASAKDTVDIDLFSDDGSLIEEEKTETGSEAAKAQTEEKAAGETAGDAANAQPKDSSAAPAAAEAVTDAELSDAKVSDTKDDGNDFDITAEELKDIEFIPTAQRMQGAAAAGSTVKVKVNFKTVLVKGILWAFIGAFVGFGFGELCQKFASNSAVASMLGYRDLAKYYQYSDEETELGNQVYDLFEQYCAANGIDKDESDAFSNWLSSADNASMDVVNEYYDASQKTTSQLYEAFTDDFDSDEDELEATVKKVTRTSTAIWSAVIALFIGLFLGIGEGVYYGSKENAVKYALIGAAVSFVIGGISGYLAQWMYAGLLGSDPAGITAALVRGLGWAIMGLGIGVAVGLIKPEFKRIGSCAVGGLIGAFIGGCLFNYVGEVVPNAMASRGIAVVIMGILIGVGVGLLEQFAKSAWLKVIRGEFEGKEYLIFPGTTSIGNNSKNTIVLFKDKLVGPHHCDIVMQGSKYVLKDCGTPMGTVVNGMKTSQHVLRQGDAIAIGNSVLVFNTAK